MDTQPRLHGFESLRAGAIICLILFGMRPFVPPWLGSIAQFGWMGIDLFLVSSGYLIASELLEPYVHRRTLRISPFFRRRAYRVLPCYLAVLALYEFLPAWRGPQGLSPWWQFLTFTENLFGNDRYHTAFSQVWLLCVETQVYLLLPFIILVLMHRPALWKGITLAAGCVLVGIGSRSYAFFHILQPLGPGNPNFVVDYREFIYLPTWSRLDGLTAGIALAAVQHLRPGWWARLRRHGHSLFATGLALTLLAGWLFHDRYTSASNAAGLGTIFGFPVLALGLGLAVASTLSANGWLGRVKIPGASIFATLAFTLYLTHREVVRLTQHLLPATVQWNSSLALAGYHVACWVAAALLYFTIELPFLWLRDRHSGDRSALKVATINTEPAI